jgi:ABC-type transport system involved in cytochrome c biogenesis permease component
MSTAVSQTWYMTQRQLMVFARQPAYAIITLIQPVIWLFLFGNLFKKVVELGGFGTTSYLDYLVPGVVVMSALSSNMWAGMGTLDEIQRGTLNRFLTTPVSRAALMNGNVVNNGLITALQSVIIVLLGLLGGADYPGGIGGIAILIVASVLLGTIFGAGVDHRHQHVPAAAADLPLLGLHGPVPDARLDAPHRRLQSAQLGHGGGAFGDVRAPRLGCRARPLGRAARTGRGGGVAVDPYVQVLPAFRVTPRGRGRRPE